MMNIYKELRRQHGSNFDVIMTSLDGDALEICEKYQRLYEQGSYAQAPHVNFGKTQEDLAQQDAYNEIKHEILTRWLSRVPRQDMIATLNTLWHLIGLADVSYLPGEALSTSELMYMWNEVNPDEQSISINSGDMP